MKDTVEVKFSDTITKEDLRAVIEFCNATGRRVDLISSKGGKTNLP